MDFIKDYANIAHEHLKKLGIQVDKDWSDQKLFTKYEDIKSRFLIRSHHANIKYSTKYMSAIRNLSPTEKEALNEIKQRLKKQQSIEPYLSKDIYTTSMKKSDSLLKYFNIYHLHLNKYNENSKQVARADKILFLTTNADNSMIYFIDIKDHPNGSEWFDFDLLETIYDNWRHLLVIYNGEYSIEDNMTNDKLYHLVRKAHANAIIKIRNRGIFSSNFGIAGSGDTVKAVRIADIVSNNLKYAEKSVSLNQSQIIEEVEGQLQQKLSLPLQFRLISDSSKLYIHETQNDFHMPLEGFLPQKNI
jgi:hypothetical protein